MGRLGLDGPPRGLTRGGAFALAAGAAAAAVVSARIPVSPDGRYSLAWGAELARGAAPDLEAPDLPTPHPLPIAAGALLSLFGPRAAASGYALLTLLMFAVLVYAAWRLGRLLAGPAGAVAAALLVATRPRLDFFLSRSFIDVPFAALVLLAAALAAEDPRRNGLRALALLALAGLLRPEAWGLAALYGIWLLISGERRRPAVIAAAASAPALWLGFDLALTGDPLHSLTSTQDLALALGRQTGLEHLWPSLTDGFGDIAGAGAMAGGALFAASMLHAREVPARTAAAVLAGVAAAGVAAFCAIAVLDLPLNDRYLLVPALAAVVLGGAAAGRARALPAAALAAALALVPAAVALPGDLADTREAFDQARSKRRADEDLERLLGRAPVRAAVDSCPRVAASGTARAAVAALTSRDPADVVVALAPVPPRGAAALSTADTVPPGIPGATREGAWVFVDRCRGAQLSRRAAPRTEGG